MRVDVPDRRLLGAIEGVRRHLLLVDPDRPGPAAEAALAVAAFAAWGFLSQAREIVLSLWTRERTDGSFDEPGAEGALGGAHLWALGELWRTSPDPDLARDLRRGMAAAAEHVHGRGAARRPPVEQAWAGPGMARALPVAGETGDAVGAEALCRPIAWAGGASRADGWGGAIGRVASGGDPTSALAAIAGALGGEEPPTRRGIEVLDALLDQGAPLWSWPARGASGEATAHPLTTSASFLLLVRSLLVEDASDGLRLLPELPGAWLGQPIEVHDAPTSHGLLSFAVRWHGERPALLWQLAHSDGGAHGGARITIPGLDPGWSSTDPAGDALLATFGRSADG